MKAALDLVELARRWNLPLRAFPILILFNLLWVLLEAIGIGLLLPIFELLRHGGSVEDASLEGWHWDLIRSITGFFGMQISLGMLLVISFSFLILRQVFFYADGLFMGITKRRAADRIRRKAFQAFLSARSSVQDETRAGEVANQLSLELNRALSSLFGADGAIGTTIQILIYVGTLFLLSPPMTVLSIAIFCLLGFLSRDLLIGIKNTGAAITDANSELTGFLVERLQQARLIRLSGMEKAESSAFAALSSRQADEELRHKLLTMRLAVLPEPVAVGFGYTVLYVGGAIFGLSLATLGLFVIVLIRLLPIVKSGINDYNNIVGRWPAVAKVDQCLRTFTDAREDKGGSKTFEGLEQSIRFDNVSFSYQNGRAAALSSVSVTLLAHRMSALVGPSGAGKSTFVDLLPRLRVPSAGRILFDGVPIDQFSIQSLRTGIAFVPQQPQIFNISAAEHIRYGKENATDEEVRQAARLAGALHFIDALPEGFETLLGDGGRRLSGGQRQRLDIARALVRRAPILILDEPTSALDAEAESAFRDALATLRAETNLTIIVIAHRLSTIADASKIVVLREGEVEAVGSHDELIAAGGWYARVYKQHSAAVLKDAITA